jgi:CRISPR/Cas system CSM-associated protein Csm3 (group 7 of RAMP superfamily)
MNPYDFVSIDWAKVPLRRKPIWHYQLAGSEQQPLYSGHIALTIEVETPLFIGGSGQPKESLRDKSGDYIIPGSSLKGMLRNVTEALCRGCLTLFDGSYKDDKTIFYDNMVPPVFRRCGVNTDICLSCRIFGMMQAKDSYTGREDKKDIKEGRRLFLGKVNISDANCPAKGAYLYKNGMTVFLMTPHPRHRDFYLDPTGRYIAGRKFYFHHAYESIKPTNATTTRKDFLKDLKPLDKGTIFQTRVDFFNLEADEFAALLLALMLEDTMRHKIGYAKPLGLGTVHLVPTHMELVDFRNRYTHIGTGAGRQAYTKEEIQQLRRDLVNTHLQEQLVATSWQDLQRIWRWPADPAVKYYYPSKTGWFDTVESRGKRIKDTLKTP